MRFNAFQGGSGTQVNFTAVSWGLRRLSGEFHRDLRGISVFQCGLGELQCDFKGGYTVAIQSIAKRSNALKGI